MTGEKIVREVALNLQEFPEIVREMSKGKQNSLKWRIILNRIPKKYVNCLENWIDFEEIQCNVRTNILKEIQANEELAYEIVKEWQETKRTYEGTEREYWEYSYFLETNINSYRMATDKDRENIEKFINEVLVNNIICRKEILESEDERVREKVAEEVIENCKELYEQLTSDEIKELGKGLKKGYAVKGIPKFSQGERWMLKMVKKQFGPLGFEIEHQARPDFLRGLEADVLLKDKSGEVWAVFEYNGIQHYEFVRGIHKDWDDFEEQERRDTVKAVRCEDNGVALIVFKYDEPMTEDHFMRKIAEYFEFEECA